LKDYFADLHIHIGRTRSGKAVKITGAKTLTFSNIIKHARDQKGLHMIGIIDCHSPEVLSEIEDLFLSGKLAEHSDGGLLFGGLTIIPGTELEIYDEHCRGPIHLLCYFPYLRTMKEFSAWLSRNVKNIHLSSQRVYVSGREVQKKVKALGGLFIPAHIFTPFKSLYGKGVERSLTEVLDPDMIDAVELGLSADTKMADKVAELHRYTYLTNSDAHSLQKIAREYQVIRLREPSFARLNKALQGGGDERIICNYGLDPLLGKYHETVCAKCFRPKKPEEADCPRCGTGKFIKGVSERISELQTAGMKAPNRPPYIHQVPLQFIPGVGPKLLEKLLNHFGTEMAVLHHVPEHSLKKVVPGQVAELILKARKGELALQAGGGGKYGRVALD